MIRPAPKHRTKLILARERLGLDRRQFARKIKTSTTQVYRVEVGISHPSLALMQRWVMALKLGPGASLEMFWARGAKARPGGPGRQPSPRPTDAAA